MKDIKFFPMLVVGILLNSYLIFIGAIEVSKSMAAEDSQKPATKPIALKVWASPPPASPANTDQNAPEAEDNRPEFDVYFAMDNCIACELMLKHLNTMNVKLRKGNVGIDDRALHRFLPLTDRRHPIIPVLEKDGLIESGYSPKSMVKFIRDMTPEQPKAPPAPPAPPTPVEPSDTKAQKNAPAAIPATPKPLAQ